MIFLISVLALVLVFLGAIHFYWAFGGRWGFENALPTDKEGRRVLNPKKFDCAIVGAGLSLFALFYLVKANVLIVVLPNWIGNYAGWIIAAIFLVRAIGDFKYIGFFKKVKKTKFATYDSKYYSPLTFLLGVGAILVQIW